MPENNFYEEYNDKEERKYSSESLAMSETTIAYVKAYLWMFIGAFITFLIGVGASYFLEYLIDTSDGSGLMIFMVIFIASFITQLILGFTINKNALRKAEYGKAVTEFIIYSALTGITFSAIFMYFDVKYLCMIFAGVTLYYFVLTGISFIFRKSIHKLSGFAMVGLISLAVTSLLVLGFGALFLSSYDYYLMAVGFTIFGLVVFSLLTLVDIKSMYQIVEYSQNKNAASIAAAFSLYLDFINIFIYILRLVILLGGRGSRRK